MCRFALHGQGQTPRLHALPTPVPGAHVRTDGGRAVRPEERALTHKATEGTGVDGVGKRDQGCRDIRAVGFPVVGMI